MPAAAQKIPAVPQELRVAKDSKPPRQSANVELAVELTPIHNLQSAHTLSEED